VFAGSRVRRVSRDKAPEDLVKLIGLVSLVTPGTGAGTKAVPYVPLASCSVCACQVSVRVCLDHICVWVACVKCERKVQPQQLSLCYSVVTLTLQCCCRRVVPVRALR
jgi:hypothetical protein